MKCNILHKEICQSYQRKVPQEFDADYELFKKERNVVELRAQLEEEVENHFQNRGDIAIDEDKKDTSQNQKLE